MKKLNKIPMFMVIFLILQLSFAAALETSGTIGGSAGGSAIAVESGRVVAEPGKMTVYRPTAPVILQEPVCGNDVCEIGEAEQCFFECDSSKGICPMVSREIPDKSCRKGTCPGDCKTKNNIRINVPSEFALSVGQTAHVMNYQKMEIKLISVHYNDAVACTADAKICPDGSAVGRTGPNCEFSPCPGGVSATARAAADISTPGVAGGMPPSTGSAEGGISAPSPEVQNPIIPIESEQYAEIEISTPGGCGPDADPRCLGAPAFSSKYSIKAGEQVQALGLKIKLNYFKSPTSAVFQVTFADEQCPAGCICEGDSIACQVPQPAQPQPIQVEVQSGNSGKVVSITNEEGEVWFSEGQAKVRTSKKLVADKKRIYVETLNGSMEIKVMPSTASDIAINRLKLKNYEIELKETGKPFYEIDGGKDSRLFGIVKKQMSVKAGIDAETGDILYTDKPWWSFLASE